MKTDLEGVRKRLLAKKQQYDLSYQDLEDRTGIYRSTLHRCFNGSVEKISVEVLEELAKALHTTPAYLMGWEDEPLELQFPNIKPATKKMIPILGSVACGEPIYKPAQELFVECVDNITADFALFAEGDSMINANIHNGDIVFVRQCDMVDNGQIAVVIVDNEATLKRVYYNREQQKLILQSDNPDFIPLVYVKEELENVRIIGRAVFVQSLIK